MKKFECSTPRCQRKVPCALISDEEVSYFPIHCPHTGTHTGWRIIEESKEEAAENERPEKVKLPDWVQECAIGYDNCQRRYFEVTNVGDVWVDIEYLDDGIGATCNHTDMQNCSEAQKRRFNEKEMKALVGKVLETPNLVLLVDAYGKVTRGISTALGNYTAESLMDRGFVIDGKPCYVLEHINEKGDWVE